MNPQNLPRNWTDCLARAGRSAKARMSTYPFILAAVIQDAGGTLEVSERAMREIAEMIEAGTAGPMAMSACKCSGTLKISIQK